MCCNGIFLQWLAPVNLTTAFCFAFLSVWSHGDLCFVHLVQEWKDYKLSWNTTEYGGVQSIRLPSKMIWTPDILMYNRYTNTHFSRDVTNIWRHKNLTLFQNRKYDVIFFWIQKISKLNQCVLLTLRISGSMDVFQPIKLAKGGHPQKKQISTDLMVNKPCSALCPWSPNP